MSDFDRRKAQRAERILETAMSCAPTQQGRNRIEAVNLHLDGYAEPGYSSGSGIVAIGNWNTISKYDERTRRHVEVDLTPKRVARLFERMGIEIEWSDQWTTCTGCQQLLRTDPDHHGWTPSYVGTDDGDLCVDCLDPVEHLQGLEGNPRTANCITSIDPAEHGYFKVRGDLEHGLHRGQDADPQVIARAFEKQDVERYLFCIDERSQFYSTFSVWVHEDEREWFDQEAFDRQPTDGPSVSGAMERALRAIPPSVPGTTQLASITPAGTVVRQIRQEDLMRCPGLILTAEHWNEDGTCRCAAEKG